MRNDAFSGYHPSVNLFYFALAIGFAMVLTHPVCLALSFACALGYSIALLGRRAVRQFAARQQWEEYDWRGALMRMEIDFSVHLRVERTQNAQHGNAQQFAWQFAGQFAVGGVGGL